MFWGWPRPSRWARRRTVPAAGTGPSWFCKFGFIGLLFCWLSVVHVFRWQWVRAASPGQIVAQTDEGAGGPGSSIAASRICCRHRSFPFPRCTFPRGCPSSWNDSVTAFIHLTAMRSASPRQAVSVAGQSHHRIEADRGYAGIDHQVVVWLDPCRRRCRGLERTSACIDVSGVPRRSCRSRGARRPLPESTSDRRRAADSRSRRTVWLRRSSIRVSGFGEAPLYIHSRIFSVGTQLLREGRSSLLYMNRLEG